MGSGETKWRCIKKDCTARVYTVGDIEKIITRSEGVHKHLAFTNQQFERQIISASVKRKAIDNLTERPSKLFQAAAMEFQTENIQRRDINNIKRSVHRVRSKCWPAKLPRTIDDVFNTMDQVDTKTSRGENFLMLNSREEKMIIFSCATNIRFLCSCNSIYMDGTFRYAAKFFQQLYTLHGLKNNRYVPLVFCLIINKTKQTYTKMLRCICDISVSFNVHFHPTNIVVDYETSMHQAIKVVFPTAQVIGCRFHIAQNWSRKLQQLGLSVDYRNKTEIGLWIRSVFGLLYLHPEEVGDGFVELMETKPEDPRVQEFSDYLVNNYIEEECTFPPTLWAAMYAGTDRTTNACESFHARWNGSFYKDHPNIFAFVQSLIGIQSEIYVDLQSVIQPKKSNSHTEKIKKFRQKTINSYLSGTISRISFIKIMSHHWHK